MVVLVIIRGLLEAPESLDTGDAPTPLVVSVRFSSNPEALVGVVWSKAVEMEVAVDTRLMPAVMPSELKGTLGSRVGPALGLEVDIRDTVADEPALELELALLAL